MRDCAGQGRQARDRARLLGQGRRPRRPQDAAGRDGRGGPAARQPQGLQGARATAARGGARDRRARRRRRADRRARRLGCAARASARACWCSPPRGGHASARAGARPGRPHPGAHDAARRDATSPATATRPSRSSACRARSAACSASSAPQAERRRLIDPVDRKELKEWPIAPGDEGDAKDGDLVRFDLAARARFGVPQARVRRDARQPAGPAQDQPDRRARARHPRRVSRRRAGRGADARARRRSPAAPTCARSISSPSIPSMRATTTMPSMPRPTPTRQQPAAGSCTSPSPTSPTTCARARGSTARRSCAATRSTSPTASCRCCRSGSPTTCARCSEGEERPCLAVRMVFDRHGNKKRPHVPARHDALGRQALLRGGAGRHRRPAERQVPSRCSRRALKPLWAAYARARRGARPARAARPRPAGAQDRCSTRRAGSSACRRARAARGAPPDRGVHDPGQRRRRRDAGGQARARGLPGARCALEGEARRAARFPGQPGSEAARRRRLRAGDFNRCCSAPRRCPSPISSTRWCCARSRRPSMPPRTSATSACTCPLRPLHLADPPLCRPARAPLADPRAGPGRRRPHATRTSPSSTTSRKRSPTPSAAPWRPSARPPTG